MIYAKYIFGIEDLTEVFYIREQVFEKEQKIDSNIQIDNKDKEAIHVIIKDNDNAVATGRLVFDGIYYKVGRIAVLKEHRCMKYGRGVVQMLLDKAFIMGAKEVFVHSQLQVQSFYEKLGFIKVGDIFIEANLPHIKMLYNKNNIKNCN